jgi:hypothetical protein
LLAFDSIETSPNQLTKDGNAQANY